MVSMFASSRGRRTCAAVSAAMLFAVAGCVGATSSAYPSASPAASPTATPSLSASSGATPTATATATHAATFDVSNVPQAPTGEWKSIRWVQVPAMPAGALPSPDPSASPQDANFKVAGWSRGFVAFSVQVVARTDSDGMWDGGPTVATISTTYSRDGVQWHDGTVMQQQMSIDDLEVSGVFEGPSGLLAIGESGACGDSWIEALWTSGDGVSWQKVDTRKAFGNATIEDVSGGSSGFVASDSTGHKVWTSRDGQSWRPVNLGAPVFASSRIDDGTAFSGGFLLAGSTVAVGARSCAVAFANPSALPTPAPPMRSPAVWWSSDGGTWTKAELPGGTSAYRIQMSICRANDHTLVAFENYDSDQNSGGGVWVSNDGRTWSSPAWPSGLNPSEFLTDGPHGVLATDLRDPSGPAPAAEPSISMVSDDGGLIPLAQQGDLPPYSSNEQWAVGPTGILWMAGDPWSGSIQLWIGLPSEG